MKSIRSLREKVRKGEWFTAQMKAINRKQVPLCKEHHRKLHKKELTPEERKAYEEGLRAYSNKSRLKKE